ncbi:MAG: TolC family protein [Nitrospirae bacterium]|nr:TolC family protein [Nitrospirota bacterium]
MASGNFYYTVFLSVILALLMSGTSFAGERVPLKLTIEETIELVKKQNLSLRVDSYKPGIAEADLLVKWGNFDPLVSLDVNDSYMKQSSPSIIDNSEQRVFNYNASVSGTIPTGTGYELKWNNLEFIGNSPFLTLNRYHSTDLDLSLKQPVLKGFGVDVQLANVRVSKNAVDMAKLDYGSAVVAKVADAVIQYWDLSSALASLESAGLALSLAESTDKEVKAKIKAGAMARVDVYTTEAEIAEREESLIESEKKARDADNNLKAMINLENTDERLDPVSTPPEGVQAESPEDIIKEALASRQDYQRVLVEKKSKEILAAYYKNQMLPDLSLQAEYGYGGLGTDYKAALNQLFDDGKSWKIGFMLTVPIGNRKNVGNYHRAKFELEQMDSSILQLEQTIRVSVKEALTAVLYAQKKAAAATKTRIASEKKLEAEDGKFKAGLAALNDVLKFQRDYANSVYEEKKAKNDFAKALVNLNRVKGRMP